MQESCKFKSKLSVLSQEDNAILHNFYSTCFLKAKSQPTLLNDKCDEIEKTLDWAILTTAESKDTILKYLEEYPICEQYYASIIVSIKQRNLMEIVLFFHENNRHLSSVYTEIYNGLIDLLKSTSK